MTKFKFARERARQGDKFYPLCQDLGAGSFFSAPTQILFFKVTGPLGIIAKKVKGCDGYFSATFSWTSPLLDRKVPTLRWCYRGRFATATFNATHTALQCWNNMVTIRNNAATLCCAKNRCSKSSRVTTPLLDLYFVWGNYRYWRELRVYTWLNLFSIYQNSG